MKKNVMLKIASVLMVAVLLTTCAISSTFAKYVTAEKEVASNMARAAKWGLTITATAPATSELDEDKNIKLFLNSYDGEGDLSVEGHSDAIVVAPGTSNASDAFAIKVEGQPEVAYQLIVKANLALSGWEVGESASKTYYCPLIITVDGTEYDGMDYTSMAAFETAVENAIVTAILGEVPTANGDSEYIKTYAPNTPVNSAANDGVAVSWRWDFDESADNNIDNEKDSLLGDAAANTDTQDDPTIQISFSVEAQQVDTYTAQP